MIRLYQLIVSPEALEDLADLHAYIAEDSVESADRVYAHVTGRIDLLSQMPYLYPVYQGWRDPELTIHKMSVNPYIVYYRVSEATTSVNIARALQSVRRQPRRFR